MAVVDTSPATCISGFRVLSNDPDDEWKVSVITGMCLLEKIGKTLVSMDQKLGSISDTQLEMRDTLVSMDNKMDELLNNDAQILEILRSMRAGKMLRIPK